ncbi:MAG: universal stress protein [Nocardioidaceae bacterium]
MDVREHVIVCGVDGSGTGHRALAWAMEEARLRGCRLRAVTAWTWNGIDDLGGQSNAKDARSHAEIVQRRALVAAMDTLESAPEIERRLVEGQPSVALFMASLDAEMLVLGGCAHSSFHDAVMGSTAQRAIRHAPCPVVVVPGQQGEHGRRRARHRRRATDPPTPAPLF